MDLSILIFKSIRSAKWKKVALLQIWFSW